MYGMYSFKPCLALFLLLLSTQKGLSADFYVGPAVVDEVFPDDDPNWGISEALPFETISYALTRIQGGDTLWIKTHTYTEQIDLNVLSSGLGGTAEPPSEAAPILIKGYETSTGDLDSGGGIPSAYGIGAISTMPSVSGNNNGFGVRLRGHDYVTIMNLRVAGFRHGLYSVDSNHCIIKHVLCEDIGDAASNDGNGIRLKGNASNQNLIDKCYVLNAPYIGIYIQDGDNNRVENCQVYADDDTDSRETDYFICVSSSYNIVKLCRTKMIANGGVGLSGGSHGIVLQGRSVHAETAHDNTVINCHMTNHHDQLLFRGTNCYENDVIDCHLMKEDTNLTSSDGRPIAGGISFNDGARNNSISHTRIDDALDGVRFLFMKQDLGAPTAGNNNVIENCIFDNCRRAVVFHWYKNYYHAEDSNDYAEEKAAENNAFVNCTFFGTGDSDCYFFVNQRANTNSLFMNCIVANFSEYAGLDHSADLDGNPNSGTNIGEFPIDAGFLYCCFFNPSGQFPNINDLGPNNISQNPVFTDLDFHLASSSPCKDAGHGLLSVDFDFDSRSPYSCEIGAQEID